MTVELNSLLAGMPATPRAAIAQAAEPVELRAGTFLATSGEPTTDVYFVEAGVLSCMLSGHERPGVEVGLIGREGLAGAWLALGNERAPFDVVVRASGRALRLGASAFREACIDHPDLRAAVLAYSGAFTGMVAETCRAHARLTVEGRLARWLMLAHDRLDGEPISITHEALSEMLGVRRPGVTVALHMLEGERMVKARRGLIQVLDREKLALAARGRSHVTGAQPAERQWTDGARSMLPAQV